MQVDQKLELPFMVCPDELKKHAIVVTGVGLTITDSAHELYAPYLGKSGRLLADAGFTFYFEKGTAQSLIDAGVATRV